MENGRPNIRIEIQNNLAEPMEVDSQENTEKEEEGEISDSGDVETNFIENLQNAKPTASPVDESRAWMNTAGEFSLGIDTLDKEAKEKLQIRAKRFGLKPSELPKFTDEDLQKLHHSLGIGFEKEKEIRFEAIHVRGTDEMSTEDIFDYFGKYGPLYIEWISDDSCNVVWEDRLSAAQAMHFISKPIKGMPVEGPCNPFVKELVVGESQEDEEEKKGRSILLKNREVELQKEDISEENKENSSEFADISDIKIPIPPGYWRLGTSHPKSKGILIRFSFRSDKKPFRAEKFSEYYKKYGNPNYGGLPGIISESKKRRMKGIFDRNKDIMGQPKDKKNPWGILAENWDEDVMFREKDYKAPATVTNKDPDDKSNIMNRLGFKKAHSEEESKEEPTNTPVQVKKKIKIPRMRMYADEEEEKLKHKRRLKMTSKSLATVKEETDGNDLRKFLLAGRKISRRVEGVRIIEETPPIIDITDDLSDKLTNRRTVTNESKVKKHLQSDILKKKHTLRSDIILEEKAMHRDSSELQRSSPSHRRRSSVERERRYHHPSSHSYESSRHRRHHSYSDSEKLDTNRTRSKVAVVVKTQKKPTVASTVWTRIDDSKRSSGRSRFRGRSTSSSETSSESESSSESSSSSSSSESSSTSDSSEDEENTYRYNKRFRPEVHRPGFSSVNTTSNYKSPLRIEIKNDRFKKK